MKTPQQIAEDTTGSHFSTYEDSAEEVDHPAGQPIVETWPALNACVAAAIEADRAQRIQVGDLVESIHQSGLDSRRVIALGGAGDNAWLWLDFQQNELDAGLAPTKLPLSNYRKIGGSEPDPVPELTPTTVIDTDWAITWAVDVEELTPLRAAIHVWQDVYGRGFRQPRPDDACVFTVTDRNTGATTRVDLSDPGFADEFHR